MAATEQAVLSELDTTPRMGVKAWAGVIGGGSIDYAPVEIGDLYAGLIAGAHARISQMLDLGGLGGIVQSQNTVLGGEETVNTSTGGLGLNQSSRQVVAGGATEIATGLFASAYAAPHFGISVPVLSADLGTISLETSGEYVGGLTTGYTETGSSMNLTVGSQTIGVVDARLGLALRNDISVHGGNYTLTARTGVSAQSNFGTVSVPVTVWGTPLSYSAPNSSALGLYLGLGVEGRLENGLRIAAQLDGAVRSDGVTSAAARASLSGTF